MCMVFVIHKSCHTKFLFLFCSCTLKEEEKVEQEKKENYTIKRELGNTSVDKLS